ncbi:hypothetical protein GOBAR_DD13069 [Gossypium barbadense]|nr:hypothetical protein GOBAR_DD13069 [Gossypium barbadense]
MFGVIAVIIGIIFFIVLGSVIAYAHGTKKADKQKEDGAEKEPEDATKVNDIDDVLEATKEIAEAIGDIDGGETVEAWKSVVSFVHDTCIFAAVKIQINKLIEIKEQVNHKAEIQNLQVPNYKSQNEENTYIKTNWHTSYV